MSNLIASEPTRAPAIRERDERRDHAGHADDAHRPEPSRVWAWLEALAYAGAYIDPSGVLAVQYLRRVREEQERLERR